MSSRTPSTTASQPDEHTTRRKEALERWERERAQGRTTFVVRRGIIGWGLPAAILTIAYKVLQERGFTTHLVLSQNLRIAIAVSVIVFPLCGYLFGHWLWREGEARYGRLKREEEQARR
jgi:hypothetical protein